MAMMERMDRKQRIYWFKANKEWYESGVSKDAESYILVRYYGDFESFAGIAGDTDEEA